jgi:hypothetical protein
LRKKAIKVPNETLKCSEALACSPMAKPILDEASWAVLELLLPPEPPGRAAVDPGCPPGKS